MLTQLILDQAVPRTMESTTLELQREHYYSQRRRWLFRFHLSNWLSTPKWIKGTPYQFIYQDAAELLQRGSVVWAYIVQANSDLYYPGPDDHPAHVLFGVDDQSNNLDVLRRYAEQVFCLFKAPSAPLPTFINMLKSVDNPVFNKKLPSSMTGSHKVCFTTTMIQRQYLPDRKVQASWYPMLIHPTQTDASIVLPSRYWLPAIKEAWKDYKDWAPE